MIVAALLVVSCDDFLDEAPKMQQSTELTLATYTGLNNATFAAYSPLVSTNWYGASFIVDAELRSGNGYRDVDKNSGRYTVPYNFSYTSTATPARGTAYYVISAVNNVIPELEGKVGVDGVTQQDVDNLRAECLFLRGLAHFDLVRTYAKQYTVDKTSLGVPYVVITDPAGQPARDNVETVYNNIVADLTEAEGLIANGYTRGGVASETSVVSKLFHSSATFQGVPLYGRVAKSADYATTVITSGKYELWEADEYAAAFKEDAQSGGEVIFDVYGLKANSYDGYWEGINWLTRPDGYSDAAASNDLVELYDEGDVRGTMFVQNLDEAPAEPIDHQVRRER